MRITTKGRYALRAIMHLAKARDLKPVPIKRIAKDEEISAEFLEQIFFRLKKAQIIRSVRGPGGGFILNRPPAEITIRDVFTAVGEGVSLTPCVLCNESKTPDCCPRTDKCLIHSVWNKVTREVTKIFDSYTLGKILKNANAAKKAAGI